MARQTFRKQERKLVDCDTELTLPNGEVFEAKLSDESPIGCCIRLHGDIEIEVGNLVRVKIGSQRRKSIVRRVEVDDDCVVIGLEYQSALFFSELKN